VSPSWRVLLLSVRTSPSALINNYLIFVKCIDYYERGICDGLID
jgi:hypothetical protein